MEVRFLVDDLKLTAQRSGTTESCLQPAISHLLRKMQLNFAVEKKSSAGGNAGRLPAVSVSVDQITKTRHDDQWHGSNSATDKLADWYLDQTGATSELCPKVAGYKPSARRRAGFSTRTPSRKVAKLGY